MMIKFLFPIILITFTSACAIAGGYNKNEASACTGECQRQIDELKSSQAQQDEAIITNNETLKDHDARLADLEKSTFNPWYLRTGIALSWTGQTINCGFNCKPDWDTDTGYAGVVALGREIGNFKAEMEFKYNSSDLEDHNVEYGINKYTHNGDLKISTIMMNGFYSIPIYSNISIYAVAGIGYAKYDIKLSTTYEGYIPPIDSSSNDLAYKMGTGVTYNFTKNWAVDLGYEYLGIADNDASSSINGNSLTCSLIYKF